MFYSIFGTLFALLGAYNQNSTLYYDFNHVTQIQKADLDSSETVVGHLSYDEQTGTSTFFEPRIQDVIYHNGQNDDYYNVIRYYISASPSSNSYLAYLDFYCDYIPATQQENVEYYLPTLKLHVEEQFNFQIQFTWRFNNSQFPSSIISYSRNIDFSQETNRVEYLQVERSTLLSSTYLNSLSTDLIITGCSMSQEQFNSIVNAQESSYDEGYTSGYADGKQDGYQNGYANGYTEGSSQDATAVVIFTGIINVALLPVNVFLQILNFEVFGINIGGLVSAFLTIAIIIIIIRIVTGKKSED